MKAHTHLETNVQLMVPQFVKKCKRTA